MFVCPICGALIDRGYTEIDCPNNCLEQGGGDASEGDCT